jgi:hypothetical protein
MVGHCESRKSWAVPTLRLLLRGSALSTGNTTIWHDGTADDIGFSRGEILSSQEIGISEVSSAGSSNQNGILKAGSFTVSTQETRSFQIASAQISAIQQASIKANVPVRATKYNKTLALQGFENYGV